MQRHFGQFTLTDDRNRVDLESVHKLLSTSYWARGRSKERMERSFANSICISVFENNKQVGFARVLSDMAVISYIADVIVDPNFRGRGIGKEIIRFIQDHPDLQDTTHILRTEDAQGLYQKFGFADVAFMSKRPG